MVDRAKIAAWFEQKYLDWQVEEGRSRSKKEFAAYLKVHPSTLSGWINDGIPPQGQNLQKVGAKLGTEIYDLAGEPLPPQVEEMYDLVAEYRRAKTTEQKMQVVEDFLRAYGFIRSEDGYG